MKKIIKNIVSEEKGYVISIIVFFILIIMMSMAISVATLIAFRQQASTNFTRGITSYYTSESGIEDALLRLRNNPNMSALSYSVSLNGATANVVIPSILGGSRAITASTSINSITKNLQVVYSFTTQSIGFHYGAQVGAGGLDMGNGSQVLGNVFSNGNVTGSGTINNNLVVASNGNGINGPSVLGSVTAYNCLNPTTVGGSLTYVTGGSHTCAVTGSTTVQSTAISPQPLPISQAQIDGWIAEATNSGTITGDYDINNNQTQSLGPQKITGNLHMGNNSVLNVTGTLYVQGNLEFGNNDTINLDPSFGSLGGTIVVDGTVDTGNSTTFNGSGQAGSYVLIISTSNSSSAIRIANNATGAIFYASNGTVTIDNNVSVQELTGYRIKMNNNSTVTYSSGLQNVLFTDGPGGVWEVVSWQEQ